ncbi:MAG: hypothetical protein WAU33_18085 [Candidatus Binataceae bacterium]
MSDRIAFSGPDLKPLSCLNYLNCVLFISAISLSRCTAANNSPRTYSNSDLVEKWKITSTLASYAKFGGGPQLGSGEIEFDTHRGIRGQQIYLGELDSVNGTYVMIATGKELP